jgi:hypothetical protein
MIASVACKAMSERDRLSYQDEAEAPFDPAHPDERISEWGPPVECRAGPAGLCWHNARQIAGSPPDEFLYAEGLAFNRGEWSGHAWVVRKSDGEVIECTAGYDTSTRYRGICLEIAEVEAFIDGRPLVNGHTCRQRWHTTNPDGSVRSEAPGVIAILAEEVHMQQRDIFEWHKEQTSWLDRSKCHP